MVRKIKDTVKERKEAARSPKQVIAIDALPLTSLGKPDKKTLRAKYLWTSRAASAEVQAAFR